MTLSPSVPTMAGIGNWLLMPMTGLVYNPSGLASTHVILKSYVSVAAREVCIQSINRVPITGNIDNERAMATSTRYREFEMRFRMLKIADSEEVVKCKDENAWHDNCQVHMRSFFGSKMTLAIQHSQAPRRARFKRIR